MTPHPALWDPIGSGTGDSECGPTVGPTGALPPQPTPRSIRRLKLLSTPRKDVASSFLGNVTAVCSAWSTE